VEVTTFTGPAKETVIPSQIDERNVHAVHQIADRKESSSGSYTPTTSTVSLEVRDHPLQLVLRVVIQRLNETHPHNDIHKNQQGILELELTPADTARHIVAHAKSLLEPYKNSRQIDDENLLIQDFMQGLNSAIEQGFNEAQVILQNLGVLQGTVERDIDNTFELVQNNLLEFRNTYARETEEDV